MPKKNNETIAWDGDVWADVEEEPVSPPAAKPELPVIAKIEVAPVPEVKPVVTMPTPPVQQKQLVAAVVPATVTPPSKPREVEQPSPPSVSLFKKPVAAVQAEPQAQKVAPPPVQRPPAPAAQPPPLPMVRKTPVTVPAVVQPPPLPKTVSTASERPAEPLKIIGKPPTAAGPLATSTRKPPSGLSSIFTKGQPEETEPAADGVPAKEKPKLPRPGLGPAFARESEPTPEE